jgi:hypothetical protein
LGDEKAAGAVMAGLVPAIQCVCEYALSAGCKSPSWSVVTMKLKVTASA